MRSSQSLIDKRRNDILNILTQQGFVKVKKLAQLTNTSTLTIRRDLDALETENKVERFYGGALIKRKKDKNNIFDSEMTIYKQSIARHAAQYIEDGDTIFINTSSTAIAILPFIKAAQVTVITNNLKAIFSERPKDLQLVFTGGELRFPKESMVGAFAVNNLNKVSASKCFLGCNGISSDEGLTTTVLHEAAINSLMLTRVTGSRFVLADKTKIGRQVNFTYGPLDEVNYLITDEEAPQDVLSKLPEHIKIIKVPLKWE